MTTQRQVFIEFTDGQPGRIGVQFSRLGDAGEALGWVNVTTLGEHDPLRNAIRCALAQALGVSLSMPEGQVAMVSVVNRLGGATVMQARELSGLEQAGAVHKLYEAADEFGTALESIQRGNA